MRFSDADGMQRSYAADYAGFGLLLVAFGLVSLAILDRALSGRALTGW